jgi:hypothetical protein
MLATNRAPGLALPDTPENPPLSRSTLYRVAALAATLAALLTPVAIAVFAIWPPPYDGSAKKWFDLYHDNALLGLMSFDLAFVVISVLLIPVMLTLYVALRRIRPAHMAIAGVLYLVAMATYFGTNTTFEMLSLSNRYAEAATEAQRLSLLGAGEAMLATFNGTAFHVYYILGQLAGIIFGVVMLRSHLFGRWIAYLMIGGNAFGFLLYVPEVGLALSAFSGVILWIWMILVARRFLQLARHSP